jgi:hypothetical protein
MKLKQLLKIICFHSLSFFFILDGSAQNKIIIGKVTDIDNGSPLPNVSIICNETKTGTQTDSNGNFHLSVPVSIKKLSISAIGYLPRKIDVAGSNDVNVVLVSKYSTLNDVVVIGYGTAKKKDLTGAVSSISEKDFNNGTYTSPDQLIQGKVEPRN